MKTLALAALMPCAAAAADLTVAGLLLGAPIVTTPCPAVAGPVIVARVVCLTDVVQLAPDMWTATIVLPYGDKPAIMKSARLNAYSKAGALVGVDFSTHGMTTQIYDLDALVAKYGQPTFRSTLPMQNRAGGKFEVVAANWNLDGLSVVFLGATTRYDEGVVTIETPAGGEVRAAAKARLSTLLNPRKL